METFGDVLKRIRAEAGMNQAELGRAANVSQSWVSRVEAGQGVDESSVRHLEDLLHADGQLMAAYLRAQEKGSAGSLVVPGRDTWAFSDLLRKIHRTDVGSETIDQLKIITEQLCCEYVSRPAEDLRADAHRQLEYVERLISGPTTLAEHRELLVIAGWLSLLIGCVNYDLGLARDAESARSAAFQLGREAGHGEIIAWAFEMSAWFAITQGRFKSVLDYAGAGHDAAPHASVAVQLAAQGAKAQARIGDKSAVRKELDKGARLLEAHEHPTRPENHFVIDPAKWDFYAMDCYRLVGENERAAEHAREIVRFSERPDGSDRSPMRASEARLTLATVALRERDLDGATEWARKAFSADRKSVRSLSLVADELYREVRQNFETDSAAGALREVIADFYSSVSGKV
ncbi:helix-turn-helix domain-containing protein [Amycolatopsis saalfeldensis]|uniref:helix-turn-helix domain-containing protein n=1 Tax=Amycolatopsis saalfeldensis TaxID=394193 RepID=UPI001FE6622E|nr:helix-turn-helix transcriptional regulator [Amycolatopsis saalfeldensis]